MINVAATAAINSTATTLPRVVLPVRVIVGGWSCEWRPNLARSRNPTRSRRVSLGFPGHLNVALHPWQGMNVSVTALGPADYLWAVLVRPSSLHASGCRAPASQRRRALARSCPRRRSSYCRQPDAPADRTRGRRPRSRRRTTAFPLAASRLRAGDCLGDVPMARCGRAGRDLSAHAAAVAGRVGCGLRRGLSEVDVGGRAHAGDAGREIDLCRKVGESGARDGFDLAQQQDRVDRVVGVLDDQLDGVVQAVGH